jgi:hypothetical protein
MSFASDEMSVMNSTQQSISRSRASLLKLRSDVGERISEMIFWTVAGGEGGEVFVSERKKKKKKS